MGAHPIRLCFSAAMLLAAAGCTQTSSRYTGDIVKPPTSAIVVCHGYDCYHKSKMPVSSADANRYRQIMAAGSGSPQAERAAVSKAIQYFEERSAGFLGVRDTPLSQFGNSGKKGEMDCIDEATNSQSLLRYLDGRKLLKYHKPEGIISRGFVLDGQFPHVAATLKDPGGVVWAVDSWAGPVAATPIIMPASQWRVSGNLSKELEAAF